MILVKKEKLTNAKPKTSLLNDLVLLIYQDLIFRDLPDCSVVKMPPSNAGGAGSIPGQGTNIPHASSSQKFKKKKKKKKKRKRNPNFRTWILDRNPLTIHREESGAFNLAIREDPK